MRFKILTLLLLSLAIAGCTTTEDTDAVYEQTTEVEVPVLPIYMYAEDVDGDVCRMYDNNFRIEGSLLTTESADAGVITYTDIDGIVQDIKAVKMIDVSDATNAIELYLQGDYVEFNEYLPDGVNSELTEYYYYSVDGESHMNCIHDAENEMYYSIIPYGQEYLLVSSPRMFYVTMDAETIQFDDPTKDPLTYHVRSVYEEMAVANTIMALQGQRGVSVSNSSGLYNTEADKQKRRDMVSYNNNTWNPDGTSDGSPDTIDTKSPAAKASQWTLQATSPYSYVTNGLKLYGLYGVKSSDNFSIEGTVQNLFDSERPWVILIKYIDNDGNLIALRAIDNTDTPIHGNGTGTFSYTLSNDVALSSITAVQFDLY